MSIIHVSDVVEVHDGIVSKLEDIPMYSNKSSIITILPGLTLTLDHYPAVLSDLKIAGTVIIKPAGCLTKHTFARINFNLSSSYYNCEETRSLLNGKMLCKLIAKYIHKTYLVDVGLVYIHENCKLGGEYFARSEPKSRGNYLYHIGEYCK
jgi:hypothetical protein